MYKHKKHHFNKALASCLIALCFALFLVLPVIPATASAVSEKNWVEVQVSVPEGFQEHVIATFENQETYEEFATRVMATNDYISRFELPVGTYVFAGAFLENSDFRYNVTLVNDASEFVISSENQAAVSVLLQATYNEQYSDGAALPSYSEPVSEPDDAEAQAPAQEEAEPTTSEASTPSEEPSADPEPSEDPEISEEPKQVDSKPWWVKLILSVSSAAVFVGLVFLFAYLYRRHIENS